MSVPSDERTEQWRDGYDRCGDDRAAEREEQEQTAAKSISREQSERDRRVWGCGRFTVVQ